MAKDRFDRRVVVIVDADSDRGEQIAAEMVRAEASVVLLGADPQLVGDAAARLRAEGGRVAVCLDDVSTVAGRATLVEMVNELFPPPNT